MDKDDPLDDFGAIFGAERFDKRGCFGVVLVNFDAAEVLETGLIRIGHKEKSDTVVVFEIANTDVLSVAEQIVQSDKSRVDDANETFGAAAMLHVGPTGFADGGHIEAVAKSDEGLFGWA